MLGQLVPRQRLNPVIECIHNVPKDLGNILPDYQVGGMTGMLSTAGDIIITQTTSTASTQNVWSGPTNSAICSFMFDVVSFES
ncbi:hypothetical protein EDB85DRAFT_1997679 [Lactarius pseudohatsudake]|nr:hypothetical protein EDB85DRAFT_1997679 [Lactarius pseudohatsudake]